MRRSLILIAVSVLIISLARFAWASTESERLSATYYNPEEVDLSDAIHLYHTRITDYFNKKILLFLLKDQDTRVIDTVPELSDDGRTREQACTEFNISTYCVSMGALDEYLAYVKYLEGQKEYFQGLSEREQQSRENQQDVQEFLQERRQKILEQNREREERGLPSLDVDAQMETIRQSLGLPANDGPGVPILRTLPIGAAVFSAANRLATIQNELVNSKRALDATVSAYHEFRMAYPLHIEYANIIERIKIFRDNLAALRREIEQFPAKFIDASSPDCT